MRSPFRPHSLRTGAAVAFATYGALVCAVIVACLASAGRHLAVKTAEDHALAVATAAALSVDGAAHLRVRTEDNDERALQDVSLAHQRLWATLPGPAVLYTMIPRGDDEGWHYVAVGARGDNRSLKPGDLVRGDYRPVLERALHSPSLDPQPYPGPQGTWVRAYAPVRTPDGEVVGVLAAEVPVPFADLLIDARWMGLGAILLVILAGVGIGLWRSTPLVRLLRVLTHASTRLARGHALPPLPVRGHSELARLVEAFNQIAGAMKDSAHEANTDGLTGLYNHRYLQERLAHEVLRANRYAHRVALLMIDIDHFKAFNDRYGHPAGDDVLEQVADAMRGAIRDIDVAARYGGEEFVVIMPEADSFVGMEQAELIRLAIRRRHFQIKTDASLNGGSSTLEEPEVSVSVGVAECPANASDPASLVAAADLALLRAKQMGRDRVCAYQAVNVIEGNRDCQELHRLIHQERSTQRAGRGSAHVASPNQAFTCAHCQSVTRYAMTLAHALGLAKREAEEVRRAALWLDVNRFRQTHQQPVDPDQPAAAPASQAQSADIWEVRTPTTQALLSRTFRASSVPANVLHMREWYNGQGYPDRLVADEIPLPARILAVADMYERLLVGDGDADPLPAADALSVLEGRAGNQLDPKLLVTFRAAVEAGEKMPTEIACAAASQETIEDQQPPEPATDSAAAREVPDQATSVSA